MQVAPKRNHVIHRSKLKQIVQMNRVSTYNKHKF